MENTPELYRIALFFHTFEVGGAERVMLQLAQGFMETGHHVDLVMACAEGPLHSEVPAGVRVFDFNTQKPLVMFLKLAQYLRAEKPKVLLSPFEVTSVIAILAKKITRVSTRVVVRISTHLSLNKRTKLKKVIERIVVSKLYPHASGIVAVSRGVAEDLASYTGLSLEGIKVIYNPVISNNFLEMAMLPVDHPFFGDDKFPVILGVGRFSEEKDFSTLIRAFDIVHRKARVRLVILGDGQKRSELENLIRSFDLQNLVDLPGFETNPFAFLKRASVFVLSSKWEGLPNALIQALACDCPVVSTDCPSGPSEILADGQYGYLVPVGDAEAMAKAIEAVLTGDTRKPPKSWLEQYKIDSVIPQYKAVFDV
jgi:glycosyltransferase involved in cell wall biosynthesis